MIQPGLERIGLLLKNVHFPWKSIHVAGTNGKGSICAYASALLTRHRIRNGRFTSPHTLDRWDCIQINDEPVEYGEFRDVEKTFLALNEREMIGASEFELLTATAFQLFNQKKVAVGVVEVGMGGRLDATNILNNQAVSVISKIAYDHQAFLGNTLESIATHKAGILRPNVPYIVNPVNEWAVQEVIDSVAREVNAGPRLQGDTREMYQKVYSTKAWKKASRDMVSFQRDNSVSAFLAFREACNAIGQPLKDDTYFLDGLSHKKLPGRQQTKKVKSIFGPHGKAFFLDGAHNEDAAEALAEFLSWQPISTKFDPRTHRRVRRNATWVLAMTEGRDPAKFLSKLLQPGDRVVTTKFDTVQGMPWVRPMDPHELLRIAQEIHPNIEGLVNDKPFVHRALATAKHLKDENDVVIVTGSLYLVGDFLREEREYKANPKLLDSDGLLQLESERVDALRSNETSKMEEADRAGKALAPKVYEKRIERRSQEQDENERIKLKEEIFSLEEELTKLSAQKRSNRGLDTDPLDDALSRSIRFRSTSPAVTPRGPPPDKFRTSSRKLDNPDIPRVARFKFHRGLAVPFEAQVVRNVPLPEEPFVAYEKDQARKRAQRIEDDPFYEAASPSGKHGSDWNTDILTDEEKQAQEIEDDLFEVKRPPVREHISNSNAETLTFEDRGKDKKHRKSYSDSDGLDPFGRPIAQKSGMR